MPGETRTTARAFTLIELLVVVAIIALLISILLPSLARARIQAKLASDKANCKQIGTMMAAYQSEYHGAVPVVFNWHAGPVYNVPARSVLLSLALRGQDGRTGRLPPSFDPQQVWSNEKRTQYERTLLPDYFVCPFVRNDGDGVVVVGSRRITGPGPTKIYRLVERRGRYETYHTWLWEDIIRGQVPHNETHPNDPREGRPKYSVLSWNRVLTGTQPEIPGAVPVTDLRVKDLHRKWSAEDARRRRSSSLSEMTVAYCAQGNHMELGYYIWNPTSHTTSAGGGTSVIFADTHVDWVRGTQVGWP